MSSGTSLLLVATLLFSCGSDDEQDDPAAGSSGGSGNQDDGAVAGVNGGDGDGDGGSSGSNEDGDDAGTGGAAGNDAATSADGGLADGTCGATPLDGCAASELAAVFVDAAALNGGDGSLTNPVNSIAEALSLAVARGATDIYVCAGDYDENVVITANETGIDLHGGFNCDGFSYDAALISRIEPTGGGLPLHVDGINTSMIIDDLQFSALDAVAAGDSSVAALVTGSADVTFNRVVFAAGTGADGDDGAPVGITFPNSLSALNGFNGESPNGGNMSIENICPAGDSSQGALGGSGGFAGEDGLPTGRGGSGGELGSCGPTGDGAEGSPGPDGAEGAGGLRVTMDADGLVPHDGADGIAGEVGGGGGGGAGESTDGGGGGGAGGCGGNGGAGGQSGGSSIGLVVFDANVSLNACELIASDAGAGGDGTSGQLGQALSVGGDLASFGGLGDGGACDGGRGGAGGDGGGGGGGAGGTSAGVLWENTNSTVTIEPSSHFTVGLAGDIGLGGGVANDGANGASDEVVGQ
ncbi:MAG TPA: hypothetical protein VHO25_19970 [Polyangiaceae bacterium]|nr:hypothetical protein [Polyangiaceae bacterium]